MFLFLNVFHDVTIILSYNLPDVEVEEVVDLT